MSGKSGWIVKEGGHYKTWKKRWMVLENNTLGYYTKENKKEKRGFINLEGATNVRKVDYNNRKYCFQVQTPERVYHICTDTEDELKSWISAINTILNPGSATTASQTPKPNTTAPQTSNNSNGSTQAPQYDPFANQSDKGKIGHEDFEKLKVIGKGSFGKVLLVRKRDNQKVYAMKVLNKKSIIERNEVEHTKSEKNILMKLSHPFLVGLHFSFQTPEKLYFIMDFVNGGELFFHLQKERRFTEERVRFYAAEIASGLEYLHSHGIIYRDLKPENLLLTNEGHITMTDFGLSKEGLLSSDARTATFCGTPEYLAPEILEGKVYGKAVDWWSFGTLVFEMLTGLPPFYADDVQQMYTKIMTAELSFPSGLNADAVDLIRRLLERDPEKRLQDPENIKLHPFFGSIDWQKLVAKAITPPYVPEVKGESDTSNIDPVFTEEAPDLSDEESGGDGRGFEGFTYVGGGN